MTEDSQQIIQALNRIAENIHEQGEGILEQLVRLVEHMEHVDDALQALEEEVGMIAHTLAFKRGEAGGAKTE